MSRENLNESLSALADGEQGATSDAVDALLNDPHARARWARYYLIGHAIRGDGGAQGETALADRVRAELEKESAVVVPFAPARNRFLRPVAGLALAASVAAVAIVGIRGIERDAGPAPAEVAQVVPSQIELPPAVLASGMRWDVKQASVEARLNNYLVNHSEYAGFGVQGMLPFARIVGYDTSQP